MNLSQTRDPDDFLTGKQLAEALNFGERTPEQWRLRGDGPPYYRPGGKKVLYRWGDVMEWVKSTRAENTAQEAA